ncbi:MAG TPA: tRNA (adenosine(37)-N6)-dimethylallyltransferase MiaA [Candidatus Saccharimonadales bacterium]|nr:tRNA (adenosine(37)-N6)-dimethylallyltransferase MiaA [Candidatus Saccharimonadales bacterium]
MAKRIAPLLVIVGETASGKSALALELAKKFNGEIIAADSWTVRREVNIGTAKPSAEEQAQVPHHLLDVAGPCEDFTAAVFKRLAFKAIDEITKRGKLPILVGGTGLYIDGVIYDFGFLPAGDRSARRKFNDLSIEELLAEIEAEGLPLGKVDVRNRRRLIRLLETNGAEPTKQALRADTLIIGLQIEREELKGKIINRTDKMIKAGLETEVRKLADEYGWGCEALKGVGYQEWQAYFLGSQNLEETRQRIIRDTLHLAKRQRTWFKRNKSIHWFNIPVDQSRIVDLVTTFLNK